MNKYNIEDIIMGTRKEYLIIEKYLLELKKLTMHTDKSAKYFYYELAKLPRIHEKPEIQCNIFPNPLTIKGFREYMYYKLFCGAGVNSIRSTLYKNNNDKYIIGNQYKNHIKDQKKFNEIVQLILNSEFANNINFNVNYENDYIKFDITPKEILGYLNINNQDKLYYNYSALDDLLILNSKKGNITEENVLNLLHTKIPENILSTYHKSLIDNREEKNSFKINIEDKNTRRLVLKLGDD